MKQSWTQGVDKELSKVIREQFVGSKALRKQMVAILERKALAANKSSLRKEGYESPSWAYDQADYIGYQRALQEIISLISD